MIQEPISTEETWLQGIPVSPGIALGKIKIQISGSKEPVAYDISPEEVDAELVRFHRALQTTADQIRTLRERMIQISGEKDASIFDAHILLLQDKIILQQVQTELLKRLQNVEHIFYVVMQNYMEVLRRVDDPYLRAKTADMEDVMQRVINNLRSTEPPEDEEETEKDQVLVAYDLTPSDTAAMDASLIHGFATEIGSSVSHTAILARSMGIPAVVGLDQALLRVESHSPAILDGYKGVLILKPTKETEEYYHRLQVEKEKAYKALEALRDLPTITRDGRNIRLSVNVEFPHEYSGIKEVGAEGVGLFRTEFFLLSNPSGMPDDGDKVDAHGHGGGPQADQQGKQGNVPRHFPTDGRGNVFPFSGGDRHIHDAYHGRMRGAEHVGDAVVDPVHGNSVLGEVIRAYGEEIHLARQHVRHDGGAGHFNHDAHFQVPRIGDVLPFQFFPAFLEDVLGCDHFRIAGDHGEHDAAAGRVRAGT